jgi:hypothetical protein
VIQRHLGQLASESALACPDDPPAHAHAVGVGNRRSTVESGLELADLTFEVGVEGELLWHDEGRDEHHPCSAVRGETAGQVQSVLGLRAPEERHHDAPVADRRRTPRETAGLPAKRVQARTPHHST